jgi:hypothetical protein
MGGSCMPHVRCPITASSGISLACAASLHPTSQESAWFGMLRYFCHLAVLLVCGLEQEYRSAFMEYTVPSDRFAPNLRL